MSASQLFRCTPLLAIVFLAGAQPSTSLAAAHRNARGAAVTPAQQSTQTVFQETVVNLAAGRVYVAVAKGAILVGTVENPVEADTHLPVPVQISSSRLAVLLGAVEWIAPESKHQIARLDQQLPQLRGHETSAGPRLGSAADREATDLEAVGDGLFNRLNELAHGLHAKIDLPAGEPIAVLIVADYVAGYGPEVWRIDYKFEQAEQSPDFWETRVLQPSYVQLWPPEKDQPRTMLEFNYPLVDARADKAAPSLVELWHKKDQRLEGIAVSDAHLGDAMRGILQGESNKVSEVDAAQFFRAALDAITPRDAHEAIAALGEESGFAWILPPPAETVKPGLHPERPSGAPSLARPSR